jgi:hypothetical protein
MGGDTANNAGPAIMDAVSNVGQKAANAGSNVWGSMQSNPDAWLKGGSLLASIFAPRIAPAISGIGSAAEGAKQGSRLDDWSQAYDKQQQVAAAQKNPSAYAAPEKLPDFTSYTPAQSGNTPLDYSQPKPPMPTMSTQDRLTLARGAPRSSDKIALEGAQAVRDQLATMSERKRLAEQQGQRPLAPPGMMQAGQMAHAGQGGSVLRGQPQQVQKSPVQQKPSLAALAQMLVQRGQQGG